MYGLYLTQITKFNNILSTASKNLMKSSFFRAQRTPVYSLVHLNDSQLCNFIVCTADNWLLTPFPSNRHHRSNGDCLEGERENYQVCSVQYSVQQLYTVNCTRIWTDL